LIQTNGRKEKVTLHLENSAASALGPEDLISSSEDDQEDMDLGDDHDKRIKTPVSESATPRSGTPLHSRTATPSSLPSSQTGTPLLSQSSSSIETFTGLVGSQRYDIPWTVMPFTSNFLDTRNKVSKAFNEKAVNELDIYGNAIIIGNFRDRLYQV